MVLVCLCMNVLICVLVCSVLFGEILWLLYGVSVGCVKILWVMWIVVWNLC